MPNNFCPKSAEYLQIYCKSEGMTTYTLPFHCTLTFHMASCICRHHLFEHFKLDCFCFSCFPILYNQYLYTVSFFCKPTDMIVKNVCFKGWNKWACFHSHVCYGSGWVHVNVFISSSLCVSGKRQFGHVMGSDTFSGVVSFSSVAQQRCNFDVKHTSFLSSLHLCLVAYNRPLLWFSKVSPQECTDCARPDSLQHAHTHSHKYKLQQTHTFDMRRLMEC